MCNLLSVAFRRHQLQTDVSIKEEASMRILIIFLFLGLAARAETFRLTSTDVKNGGTLTDNQVFNGFGCTGKNISPELQWANPPEGTKSFAVTVYDPDAPTGSGWWHWTVANIPANVKKLERGASNQPAKMPAGAVEGRTDFGKSGFGGACPPPGDKPHHYIFTVFALKTEKLEVGPEAGGAMFGYMINANSIGKASITAKYGRKK
jgi:Raf kinase inhibitor-like YbhB/YbcL family protein